MMKSIVFMYNSVRRKSNLRYLQWWDQRRHCVTSAIVRSQTSPGRMSQEAARPTCRPITSTRRKSTTKTSSADSHRRSYCRRRGARRRLCSTRRRRRLRCRRARLRRRTRPACRRCRRFSTSSAIILRRPPPHAPRHRPRRRPCRCPTGRPLRPSLQGSTPLFWVFIHFILSLLLGFYIFQIFFVRNTSYDYVNVMLLNYIVQNCFYCQFRQFIHF